MKINVDYLEYKNTIGDNMKLIAENYKLKEEVKKKDDIINKIIKYIEDDKTNYNSNWLCNGREDLLNIAKGGDQK